MFQSKDSFENNIYVRRLTLVLIGVLLCIFFVWTRLNQPKVQTVNGVYKNECCSDIILKNGRIYYGSQSLTFRLARMKYGITGYVKADFLPHSLRPAADQNGTAISFFNHGADRLIVLPVGDKEYTFKRVQ
jgi:hypothetical protein